MKVPFEEVPELTASRRVYVHKGYAYVAMNQVRIVIAFNKFAHEILQMIIAFDVYMLTHSC